MTNCYTTHTEEKTINIIPICRDDFNLWLEKQSQKDKNLLKINGFIAKPGTFCLITTPNGELEKVVLGIESKDDYFAFGALPKKLPAGHYEILAPDFSKIQLERAAIGWGMGAYKFDRYKKLENCLAILACKENYDIDQLNRTVSSIGLVRDLVNMSAADLHPEKLAESAFEIAKEFKAELRIFEGDELIKDFPAVYAVGKGSKRKPLLIDIRYGDKNDPKVALVGKGVCFDSGGLQIKPSDAMTLMKKDMAGAAHVLGLAKMIMDAKLPINLRVIIPAVENMPSGNAFKPGDVIKTRKGITIETGHTDAEGRLILSDALTLASEWDPELIFDFATLTGAARIALGPDITALFSNNDCMANEIMKAMRDEQEPVWQMPLYQPYLKLMKSDFADLRNVPATAGVGGGAITAALVLQHFVLPNIDWAHFDIEAYNSNTTPAKPQGGEASCLVGLFRYIQNRFS